MVELKKVEKHRKQASSANKKSRFHFFLGNIAFIEENPFLRKSTIACIQERPARNSYSVFYKAKDSSPDEFGYLGDHLEYLCQIDPPNSSFLLNVKKTLSAAKNCKAPALHDFPSDHGRHTCCHSGVLFRDKSILTYN